MIEWPARSRWLTGATLLYGAAFFFWIGVEDTTLGPVTALGAGIPLLGLAHALVRRSGGRPLAPRRGMLLLTGSGLLAGGLAPLSTAALMAAKVSLHAHPNPDFPPETVAGLLARWPVWALAGLLLGLALALAAYALRTPGVSTPDP